jgi:hypothetical protein
MAAPRLGPAKVRLTGRQRTRALLSQGIVRTRPSKGVVVDLDISPLYLAAADGVAVAAAELLADASANAPDDPTTPGARIPDSGGFLVYVFGQVLDVDGGAPVGWRKPRSFRPNKNGLDAVVSFRSPLHHLHEMGTVKMPARPYLGPARMRMADRLPAIVASQMPKGGPS